jgi:hypothetical protein
MNASWESIGYAISALFLASAVLSPILLITSRSSAYTLGQSEQAGTQLSRANLCGSQLQFATLCGANCDGARLEGANLTNARLQRSDLRHAHLDSDTALDGALLGSQRTDLYGLLQVLPLPRFRTQVQGRVYLAVFYGAVALYAVWAVAISLPARDHPEVAVKHLLPVGGFVATFLLAVMWSGIVALVSALTWWRPERRQIQALSITSHSRSGALLADVDWGRANLAVVDWRQVRFTGDALLAHQRYDSAGKVKGWSKRISDYQAAVRAYRQLAVELRSRGLVEDADAYAYQAQEMQRVVLLRQFKPVRWLGSYVLDLLAGYGYRPGRTLFWYVATIAVFTFLYMQATNGWIPFGLPAPSQFAPLPWYEALILSVSSFHGRGFFQPVNSLGDPVAALAALEAVIGLFIEISFIATFTQRYFGAR